MSSPTESLNQQIYKYLSPWPLYTMNCSVRPDKLFRLALGSWNDKLNNKVQIISLDKATGEFSAKSTFDQPDRPTKIMWIPDSNGNFPDLLATSGDYLRLWRAGEPDTTLERVFDRNRRGPYCTPLTSFDWNDVDPFLLATSSIDTTCTIYDLHTGTGQIRELTNDFRNDAIHIMNDIAFSRAGSGCDIVTTVGLDGKVYIFDLRQLGTPSIVYMDPAKTPLTRVAPNKQDPNYLATVSMNSCEVLILDLRLPSTPVARLSYHNERVSGMAWAPHSSCHICTAGDDCRAFIWDIKQIPRPIEKPIMVYKGVESKINQIEWSASQPEWNVICYDKTCEIVLTGI